MDSPVKQPHCQKDVSNGETRAVCQDSDGHQYTGIPNSLVINNRGTVVHRNDTPAHTLRGTSCSTSFSERQLPLPKNNKVTASFPDVDTLYYHSALQKSNQTLTLNGGTDNLPNLACDSHCTIQRKLHTKLQQQKCRPQPYSKNEAHAKTQRKYSSSSSGSIEGHLSLSQEDRDGLIKSSDRRATDTWNDPKEDIMHTFSLDILLCGKSVTDSAVIPDHTSSVGDQDIQSVQEQWTSCHDGKLHEVQATDPYVDPREAFVRTFGLDYEDSMGYMSLKQPEPFPHPRSGPVNQDSVTMSGDITVQDSAIVSGDIAMEEEEENEKGASSVSGATKGPNQTQAEAVVEKDETLTADKSLPMSSTSSGRGLCVGKSEMVMTISSPALGTVREVPLPYTEFNLEVPSSSPGEASSDFEPCSKTSSELEIMNPCGEASSDSSDTDLSCLIERTLSGLPNNLGEISDPSACEISASDFSSAVEEALSDSSDLDRSDSPTTEVSSAILLSPDSSCLETSNSSSTQDHSALDSSLAPIKQVGPFKEEFHISGGQWMYKVSVQQGLTEVMRQEALRYLQFCCSTVYPKLAKCLKTPCDFQVTITTRAELCALSFDQTTQALYSYFPGECVSLDDWLCANQGTPDLRDSQLILQQVLNLLGDVQCNGRSEDLSLWGAFAVWVSPRKEVFILIRCPDMFSKMKKRLNYHHEDLRAVYALYQRVFPLDLINQDRLWISTSVKKLLDYFEEKRSDVYMADLIRVLGSRRLCRLELERLCPQTLHCYCTEREPIKQTLTHFIIMMPTAMQMMKWEVLWADSGGVVSSEMACAYSREMRFRMNYHL